MVLQGLIIPPLQCMGKLRKMRNRRPLESHDHRFMACITEGILYLDDRWRFEWQPALAAGRRPSINIPMLMDQFLKEYAIDPQQLDPRLYTVYMTIIGRMTEITGHFTPSLQDRTNNPKRFIACFTDWVRHVNHVVEDQWKPAWRREEYDWLNVGGLSDTFLTNNGVQLHYIKGLLGQLRDEAESTLYDLRGWKVFGQTITWRRVMGGDQRAGGA